MKKVFLYRDEANIFRQIETATGFKNSVQHFFTTYKELGLPEMKTEDIVDFITNPKVFFVKILTAGETLKIGQLELNPQKVYDLFPLPPGVNELVVDIQNYTAEHQFDLRHLHHLKNIAIVDNELCICSTFKQRIEDTHTYYTETEDQNNALTLLKKIAKDLTSLKALQKGNFYNPKDWIKECLIETKTDKGIEYTEKLEKIRQF